MRDIILVSRITGRWADEVTDDKAYTLEYDAEEVLAVEAAVSNLSFLSTPPTTVSTGSTGSTGGGIIAEGLLVCKVFYVRRGGTLGFEEHRLPLSLLLPSPSPVMAPSAALAPAPSSAPAAGSHPDHPGPAFSRPCGASIEGEAEVIYVNFAFDPGKKVVYQRAHINFLIYQVEELRIALPPLPEPEPRPGPGPPPSPGPHLARYPIMARRPLVETAITGTVTAALHLTRPADTIESVSVSVADPSFEIVGVGAGIVASGRLSVSVVYVDDGKVKRHDLRDDIGFSLFGAGAHAGGRAPGARTSSGCPECEGRVEVSNVSWEMDPPGAVDLKVRIGLDAWARLVTVDETDIPARAVGDGQEWVEWTEWAEIAETAETEGAQMVEVRVDAVVSEASDEYIYEVEVRLSRRCARLTSVSAEMTGIQAEVMFDEVLVKGVLCAGFYYVGYVDRTELADQWIADGDGECNIECYEEVTRKLIRFITVRGARPGMVRATARVHVTSVDSQYDPGGWRIREILTIKITVVVTERRELAIPTAPPEPSPESTLEPVLPEPILTVLGTPGGAPALIQLVHVSMQALVQVVKGIIRFLGRVIIPVTRRIPRE